MSRLEQLRKLVAIAGNDPMPHYGLGLEYVNLGQWSEAAAAFGEALRVDPRYSAAYYHKARAESLGGNSAAARKSLEDGIVVAQGHGDWKTVNEMRELLESLD